MDGNNAYSNKDNAERFLELLRKVSRDDSDEAYELISYYLGSSKREKTHSLLLQSTTFIEEHSQELMQLLGVEDFMNSLRSRNKNLFKIHFASMLEKDGPAIGGLNTEKYLDELDGLSEQTKKKLLGKHAETIARYYMRENESELVLFARREMDARIERDYVMDIDAQLNSDPNSYIDNPPSYGVLFTDTHRQGEHALLKASMLRRGNMKISDARLTDDDRELRKNPTKAGDLLFNKQTGTEPKDLIWLSHIGDYSALVFKDPDDFEVYARSIEKRRTVDDSEESHEYTVGLHCSRHILVKMCGPRGELDSEDVLSTLRHEWQHAEFNTVRGSVTWTQGYKYDTWDKRKEFENSWSCDKRIKLMKDELLAFYCGSSIYKAVSRLKNGYDETFSGQELAKLRNDLESVKQAIVDNSGEELDYFERRLLTAHLMTVHWENIPEAIDSWFDFYKKRRVDIRDILDVRKRVKALQAKHKNNLFPSAVIDAIQDRAVGIMDELEQLEKPFFAKYALYKTTSEEVFDTHKDIDNLYKELESLYGDSRSLIFGADKMGPEERQAIGDRYLETLLLAMENMRIDMSLIQEELVDGVFEASPEVVDMFSLAMNAKNIRCTYGVRGKKINFTLKVSSDDRSYRISTELN
ncbi:hypothetical protein A2348_01390 [Candidatus Uhrbacteria bacterium RIFOXYB12_FULL_58_10]|nr:MAG: hypothetical protein A2348_01390 [Candidatus Uhrbacteria bacterium RIFOXYB12_FULL_58_10]